MEFNYETYFDTYRKLAFNDEIYDLLDQFKNLANEVKNNNAKMIFAGNGASAAISAHAAVDFTKQAKIRGITFNEADLIT
jgi:D-sedoheptulose 7-phosphate isomerase